MPVKFPAPSQGGERWSRRASAAAQDYATGIAGAAGTWQPAAAAAAGSYATGVQEAIAGGRFQKGIAAAGDAKWQQASSTLGPSRFSQGVTARQPEYERGVTAIWQKAASVQLPARGPRGSEGNYQRAVAMGKAMRQAKM